MMEFTITRAALLQELETAKRVVNPLLPFEELKRMHFFLDEDNLNIICGNDVLLYSSDVTVAGIHWGSAAVDPAVLLRVIKTIKAKELHLKVADGWLTVTGGGATLPVSVYTSENAPEVLLPATYTLECRASDLALALQRMSFSIVTDVSRYGLNGAYLEKLAVGGYRLVSTDGHRLSYAALPVLEERAGVANSGCLLPRDGVLELQKLCEKAEGNCRLSFADNRCYASVGWRILAMRLMEGDFPHYRNVVPRVVARSLLLPRAALLDTCKQMTTVLPKGRDGGHPVKLTHRHAEGTLAVTPAFSPDLKLCLTHPCQADSGLTADRVVGINAKYLADALRVIDAPEIRLDMHSGDGFLGVRAAAGGRDETYYLIAPYKLE